MTDRELFIEAVVKACRWYGGVVECRDPQKVVCPTAPEMKACLTCRHYLNGYPGSAFAPCRRFPPVRESGNAKFPMVNYQELCGEWAPKDAEHAP